MVGSKKCISSSYNLVMIGGMYGGINWKGILEPLCSLQRM